MLAMSESDGDGGGGGCVVAFRRSHTGLGLSVRFVSHTT